MSKRSKLRDKLHKNPPPTDFTWDELLSLMRQHGFTEHCQGGSHYMFYHRSGFKFSMSKTHPAGVLKRYQISAAICALETIKDNDSEQ